MPEYKGADPEPPAESLSERVERHLTVPVITAAFASVPAVFLTGWGSGNWARAGLVLGWAAGAVLWLEGLLGFVLAEDRWDWVSRHRWPIAVALLTIPALVFALGPIQLLRIIYLIATLRVLRVRRIIQAATTLNRRLALRGMWRWVLVGTTTTATVVFAAVLLLDPHAETWTVAELTLTKLGILPALLVTAILATAGYLLWRNREQDKKK